MLELFLFLSFFFLLCISSTFNTEDNWLVATIIWHLMLNKVFTKHEGHVLQSTLTLCSRNCLVLNSLFLNATVSFSSYHEDICIEESMTYLFNKYHR